MLRLFMFIIPLWPTYWYKFSVLVPFPLLWPNTWQERALGRKGFCLFVWLIVHVQKHGIKSGSSKRVGRRWVGYQAPKSWSSDLLPSARHQVIKVPKLFIIAPSAGEQIFKHMILWTVCCSKYTVYT